MILSGYIIGVDESGKGDFFGPLVVASALAGDADLSYFKELEVRDSKRIADSRILSINEKLRDRFAYKIVVLMPVDYNKRYDKLRNLNVLLAQCHAEAITGLLGNNRKKKLKVDQIISDKFGKTERLETALANLGCSHPVSQMVRGEVIPQVAAASIIARAEFLTRMDQLSSECGVKLLKGASAQVDEVGRLLVAREGPEILDRVAKKHFKNYSRAMSGDLFA